jgi:(2S)-methylsuccinyl-CoA dehydrogenase
MPLDAFPDAVSVVSRLQTAAREAQAFVEAATQAVKAKVSRDGKIDRALFDREQHVVHGLAWYATYAELFNQLALWAERLQAEGRFGPTETLLCEVFGAEYAAQLMGGIPMSQGEAIRPADFDLPSSVLGRFYAGDWAEALKTTQDAKTRLAEAVRAAEGRATVEATGLDETFEMVRDQFRAFADDKVAPYAHEWHLKDELIPLPLVEELGALGVFGLTIPEEFGGAGLGKTAMCVVSEELRSRRS